MSMFRWPTTAPSPHPIPTPPTSSSARSRWPISSPSGLQQGNQEWTVTGFGAPIYGTPNDGAHGKLISGALEQSNVETAEEMVNLITAQRYFQANAKAIDAFTQISDPSSTCGRKPWTS
jgi:hypothetical protein